MTSTNFELSDEVKAQIKEIINIDELTRRTITMYRNSFAVTDKRFAAKTKRKSK